LIRFGSIKTRDEEDVADGRDPGRGVGDELSQQQASGRDHRWRPAHRSLRSIDEAGATSVVRVGRERKVRRARSGRPREREGDGHWALTLV